MTQTAEPASGTPTGPSSSRPARYGNRPTMKDVAARAGVGLKTVSRVVNDEDGVAPDTEGRVREAITALGFRRNDSARLLRKGRTATVGLVLEDLADPFYAPLSRAVEEAARTHGTLLLHGSSAEDPAREEELVLALCARRVDGLVIVPAGEDHRYLEPELAAGIPAVFADRGPGMLTADTVRTDSFTGAREGVAHLIAHGHRRIGFVGDRPGIATARDRVAGYRAAMKAAGQPVREAWIACGPTNPERVHADAERLLSGPEPVTALFAGNNRVSVPVVRLLAGTGRSRSVAVVGFDDIELADLLTPALTVVAQDPAELGRQAARLLFARLAGDRGRARELLLPARLIARGSGELPPSG